MKTICPHTFLEQVIPLRGLRIEEAGFRGSTARAYSRCTVCHKTLDRIIQDREAVKDSFR